MPGFSLLYSCFFLRQLFNIYLVFFLHLANCLQTLSGNRLGATPITAGQVICMSHQFLPKTRQAQRFFPGHEISGGPYPVSRFVANKLVLTAIALMLVFSASYSEAGNELIRDQEIAECRNNEVVTWGDGRDTSAGTSRLVFTYTHHNSPTWFSEITITKLISRAATAWSQCGVDSQVVPWRHTNRAHYDLITIQWNEKECRGNFALANLSQRTLSLSPKMFQLLRTRNPHYDATLTLQMAISHEMGHFYGLMAHSRRCVDVMSYYTNGRGDTCVSRAPMASSNVIEYRHLLPTACDIERCRKINGKPPLSKGRLPDSY